MSTPTPSNNLGSSRLLGTDDAQRAVDSLTRQVNNLERSVANAARAFQSLANGVNRSNSRGTGSSWNAGSNFPGNNGGQRAAGGQAQFSSTTTMTGQTANGGGWRGAATVMMGAGRNNGNANGGGGAGVTAGMGRLGAAGAVVSGLARGAVNYGNKYMSTNMQMEMFGTYAGMIGGVGPGGSQATTNAAMRTTFVNNRIALDANDAARGGYTAAYTFGSPQFNGSVNSTYTQGVRQASGFAFASPTAGFTGAMNAAQQFYSNRSFYGLQAFGIQSPIGQGGRQAPMSSVAGSIMQRLYGSQSVSNKTLDAGFKQGGYAGQSLQNIGRQAGWDSQTIQMVENYMRGRNAALNKGMSAQEFDKLTQQAATGSGDTKRNALDKLQKTTNMGSSMFERQRDLNATRLNRQEQILESLAPAFEKATDAVNRFSGALNKLLDVTGLDTAIGTVSGALTPFSNALGGLGGMGGGILGGLLGGAMMRGGGGLLGRLGGLFGAGRGAAGAGGGLINATGARGVPTITSLGSTGAGAGFLNLSRGALMRGGLYGLGAYATSEIGSWAADKYTEKGSTGNKWAHVGTNTATGALAGAAVGSVVPVIGTGVGALVGGGIGAGYGIYNQFFGDGNVKKEFRTINSDGINGGAEGGKSKSKSKKKETATGASGASAAQVIKFAEEQLGDPYVWGGNGPDGWDCSGLLKWAFGQAGVNLPRIASDQQKVGKPVATDKVQPGDLLFNGNPAHHVVMAIGGGKIIEAPRPGLKVRIRNFKPGEFTNARRILGSIGDLGDISLDGTEDADTLNNQASSTGGDIGAGYGGTSELAALMSALSGTSAGGAMSLSASATSTSGGTTSSDTESTVSEKDAPKNVKANVALGKKMAAEKGWTGKQWNALYELWMHESGWRHWADNPTSDAYGIPQAMSNLHKETATAAWRNSPKKQIEWGLKYIAGKYKNPVNAWSFWNSKNPHWYDEGAWNLDQDATARVHKGEMILPAKQAESVRNAITNTLTTGTSTSGRGGIVFESGSIVVTPNGKMTVQEAQTTAKMIVDAVCEDHRIKEIQKGY